MSLYKIAQEEGRKTNSVLCALRNLDEYVQNPMVRTRPNKTFKAAALKVRKLIKEKTTHVVTETDDLTKATIQYIKVLMAYAKREVSSEYQKKIDKLNQEIKTLKGILPICSSCKNIRDDKGYWNQIESYIKDHSDADFTHSICPECAKKLYPDLNISY